MLQFFVDGMMRFGCRSLRLLAVILLLSTGVFLLDLQFLARSVGTVDAGELAAVAATFGVAHPTGYPLFTIIAHLWSFIPVAPRIIVRLNILTALLSAAGVGLLVAWLRFLFVHYLEWKETFHLYAAATAGALVIAFTTVYWSQALSIEVYALHQLFLSAVFLLFFWALRDRTDEHRWALLAYVLGLSFTNHMTTILSIPGMILAFFLFVDKKGRFLGPSKGVHPRWIISIVLFFFLGISLYLILMLRAYAQPVLNWGNPSTVERFFNHVTGKQYQSWMFSSTEVALRQLQHFVALVPRDVLYFPMGLWLAGFLVALRRNWRVALVILTFIVTCIGYAINFDVENKDIDSYFLLAYVASAFFISVGTMWLFESVEKVLSTYFGSRRRLWSTVVVSLIVLGAVAAEGFANYLKVDGRREAFAERYTHDVLASARPNALIISYQWDYFVSPFFYLHYIEHVRPDVVVLDKELMRRSWYVEGLLSRYPEIMGKSTEECRAFLHEVKKFERDEPYDGVILDRLYYGMITSVVEMNMKVRPVYVTYEVEPQVAPKEFRVPEGLLLRIQAYQSWHPVDVQVPNFDLREIDDPLLNQVRRWYAVALTQNARAAYWQGEIIHARNYLIKALHADSTFTPALNLMREMVPDQVGGSLNLGKGMF
ncbi:MAG: glycosyltransferase family 117 protein [Bacteroidota bacterium]